MRASTAGSTSASIRRQAYASAAEVGDLCRPRQQPAAGRLRLTPARDPGRAGRTGRPPVPGPPPMLCSGWRRPCRRSASATPNPPNARSSKTQRALDVHMKRFIALSPFVCLGSSSAGRRRRDAARRPAGVRARARRHHAAHSRLAGQQPARHADEHRGQSPGRPPVPHPRLQRVAARERRGRGVARPGAARALDRQRQAPALGACACRCARRSCTAARRSSARSSGTRRARVDRSALPPYGQMLKDQIDVRDSAEEIQASVEDAYKTRLY